MINTPLVNGISLAPGTLRVVLLDTRKRHIVRAAEMHEDDAAAALAAALMGEGVRTSGEPKEGKISIPSSATNIDVKARAVGGKTIFEKHYTAAMDHCYWVSGVSAWDNFYSELCP